MTSFGNFAYERVFEIVFDRETSRSFTKVVAYEKWSLESRVNWLRLLSSEYANSTGPEDFEVIRKL